MSIIGNPLVTTNYISDSFSGDASTVAFTLSQAPASDASIAVYISGLYQIPTSAYSISGTTLTFTGAPPTGTNNITVLHLGVKSATLVPVNGSVTPQMLSNANVVYWSASNNNVGIGNVTPTSLLTVTGTAALGNTTITGTLTASANVNFDSGALFVDGTNNRVGVNQASPTTTFHVNAGRTTLVANGESYALGVGYTAGSGAGYFIGAASNNTDLVLSSANGTERMRVSSNGNVGIGISTNTTRKLQIDGINTMGTGSGVEDLIALTNQNGENSGVAEDRIGFTISAQSNVADRRIGMYARAGNVNFNNPDISFWQTGQGIAYRETMRIRADTATLQFNSGYGSVASAYGCRVWVNFNGTGTVAIRGSGNVSSITDNAAGNYYVNFSNAMPDTNFASIGGGMISGNYTAVKTGQSPTTTRVMVETSTFSTWTDAEIVSVAVFR